MAATIQPLAVAAARSGLTQALDHNGENRMRKTTAVLLVISMTTILSACATSNNDRKLTESEKTQHSLEMQENRQEAAQHRSRESSMTSRGEQIVKGTDQKAQSGRPQ